MGTDFNRRSGIPGFCGAADAANVTGELLARGYSDEQVGAI
jgi:microsomal dipeptidase-like Zn-dependent dipeptidase